jgi:hypothetical protein
MIQMVPQASIANLNYLHYSQNVKLSSSTHLQPRLFEASPSLLLLLSISPYKSIFLITRKPRQTRPQWLYKKQTSHETTDKWDTPGFLRVSCLFVRKNVVCQKENDKIVVKESVSGVQIMDPNPPRSFLIFLDVWRRCGPLGTP